MSKSKFETGDLVFWDASNGLMDDDDDMGIVIDNGWPLRILWLASNFGIEEWLTDKDLHTQQEWEDRKRGS
jgi:hypothetical protein